MKEESKIQKIAFHDGKNVTIKEYDTSILPPESAFEPHPPISPFEIKNDGIIDGDDRTVLTNLTTYPNRTTCWIFAVFPNNIPQQVGTGVMMGKNTVLTCAHVLYSREYRKWARDVKVVPAAFSGTVPNPEYAPFGYAFKEYAWISGDYMTSSATIAPEYDWGVIKLTENLGDKTGFCDPHSTTEELLNKKVISKGYPNPDGTRRIIPYEAPGKIIEVNDLSYDTTIDMEQGQSGSPIFFESNQTNIIGILSAIYNNKKATKAIRITPDLYINLIKLRLEAQGQI